MSPPSPASQPDPRGSCNDYMSNLDGDGLAGSGSPSITASQHTPQDSGTVEPNPFDMELTSHFSPAADEEGPNPFLLAPEPLQPALSQATSDRPHRLAMHCSVSSHTRTTADQPSQASLDISQWDSVHAPSYQGASAFPRWDSTLQISHEPSAHMQKSQLSPDRLHASRMHPVSSAKSCHRSQHRQPAASTSAGGPEVSMSAASASQHALWLTFSNARLERQFCHSFACDMMPVRSCCMLSPGAEAQTAYMQQCLFCLEQHIVPAQHLRCGTQCQTITGHFVCSLVPVMAA